MKLSRYVLENIPLDNVGELIFTKNLSSYQDLTDSLQTAKFVKISTYNISSNNEDLLAILRGLAGDVHITLVTNIPSRFPYYRYPWNRDAAKRKINDYFSKLAPDKYNINTQIYFNVTNHSKIILTDKLAYIGSANFSKESDQNFEAGIIITAPEIIRQVETQFFDKLIQRSWRYYGGTAQELYLELENIAQDLDALIKKIVTPNQAVIQNISADGYSYQKPNIDAVDLELLGIVTWQIEEIGGDIANKLLINEGIEDWLATGLDIRAMVEEDAALEKFSGYDVEKATAGNFEDNFMDDTGENTDELMLRAQEAAMEKQDELYEDALEYLPVLAKLLQKYAEQLKFRLERIAPLAKLEKAIDNTVNN